MTIFLMPPSTYVVYVMSTEAIRTHAVALKMTWSASEALKELICG